MSTAFCTTCAQLSTRYLTGESPVGVSAKSLPYYNALALIALGYHNEQKLSPLPVQGNKPQFVNYEKVSTSKLFLSIWPFSLPLLQNSASSR